MPEDKQQSHARHAAAVCVVDPDEASQRRLRELLAATGATVRVFGSGAALLAGVEAVPACVISELRLPDMDGIGLIKALRERGIDAPVILLAGDGDVPTAVAAMRAGALDYIEKPHVDRLLVWHLHRLLEHDARRTGQDPD